MNPDKATQDGLRELLEDTAIDPEKVEIHGYEITTDSTTIHSIHGPAGHELDRSIEIHLLDTTSDSIITVETYEQLVITNGSDDEEETPDKLYLAAEDDWDDAACPECGRNFHTDTWERTSHGGDAYGGQANYSCPEPDCDGRAAVQY